MASSLSAYASSAVWWVVALVVAAIGAAFSGWLGNTLPKVGQTFRFLRYRWLELFRPFPIDRVADDEVLIVLCAIWEDDARESTQRTIARALEAVPGIGVVQEWRWIRPAGSNRSRARLLEPRRADRILDLYRNPLSAIIWGEAAKPGEAVRLHIRAAGTTETRDLTFEGAFLKAGLNDALGNVIAATALAAVRPATEAAGQFLGERLRPIGDVLARFATQMPPDVAVGARGRIFQALGLARLTVGAQGGVNAALHEAAAAFRSALATHPRDRAPLDWAVTQHNLATALATLGDRESGTARLEEAVLAYHAALEERTRDRVPLDWAQTQNNLGNALRMLGERERGTARLEEAVLAYHAALQELTRDRVPLDWAITKNNLGNVLASLGERESGTARLEAAVSAYHEALRELTRDRVPLDWAMTKNNLGNALVTLGQRESGTARLEAAVSAYRAAMNEWTRERVPLDWAMTQNNLGTALAALGKRETGTARLEAAVSAYRAALEERTRDRVPLDWAQTTENLTRALEVIADRTADAATGRAALAHIDAALAEYQRAGAAFYIENAKRLRTRLADRYAR